MKTLIEHNTQRQLDMMLMGSCNSNAPRPNGIACPDCNAELLDSTPMMMLASMPPQKNVHCVKCGYHGYRIA